MCTQVLEGNLSRMMRWTWWCLHTRFKDMRRDASSVALLEPYRPTQWQAPLALLMYAQGYWFHMDLPHHWFNKIYPRMYWDTSMMFSKVTRSFNIIHPHSGNPTTVNQCTNSIAHGSLLLIQSLPEALSAALMVDLMAFLLQPPVMMSRTKTLHSVRPAKPLDPTFNRLTVCLPASLLTLIHQLLFHSFAASIQSSQKTISSIRSPVWRGWGQHNVYPQ